MDNSIGNIISWQWDFGDNSSYNYFSNPVHEYLASDSIYKITLIVEDLMGCRDTTDKNIWIFNDYWIWIPNSFTPDDEYPNNYFCISCDGVEKENFMFNIYNRSSVLVYSTFYNKRNLAMLMS